MNIRTKLSLKFTFLVFGILLIFSGLVYYFSYSSQKEKFRENLIVRAQNTAVLLINVSEVDSTLLKKIHQTTISLEEEEIAITNSKDILIYGHNIKNLEIGLISKYNTMPAPFFFSVEDKDGVVYNHEAKNQRFNVYVAALDIHRKENLKGLRNILFWTVVFSIWLSVTASYFYSSAVIRPISRIIAKMKEINSSKLNRRLDEGLGKDEIEQLAVTFNQMLSELEKVFKSQDEFVSNASHELKTPLAVMIAESDYILSKGRMKEEYERHISAMVGDLRKLNHLLASLLELAHINRDNKIAKSLIRTDELVFNAIEGVKSKYLGRKIIPKINYSENEDDMLIEGNQGLLEIALRNVIDNACKFSNHDVVVTVAIYRKFISIIVADSGIGIPPGESETIFTPFQRASNTKFIGGYGVGLSIVSRILELHSAKKNITSNENSGTNFEIVFKKANN